MRDTRAVDWLASAAPDPAACKRVWHLQEWGVTLLPAGRRWDVVITPEHLGFGMLSGMSARGVQPGPVLFDACTRRTGFFVPPGATTRWIASGIRCAGAGTWIATPLPLQPTARLRWLTTPDGSGFLNDLPTLEYLMHDAVPLG